VKGIIWLVETDFLNIFDFEVGGLKIGDGNERMALVNESL